MNRSSGTGDNVAKDEFSGAELPLRVAAMAEGERVAIRLLRRILAPRGTSPANFHDIPAMDHAALLIQKAVDPGPVLASRPIDVAMPGDEAVTPDERVLLSALAAAQHAEDPLLDQAVSRLMPAREMRGALAEALRVFARVLTMSGRSLASPRILKPGVLAWSLPAAALTVARLHGHDLGHVEIAWPPRD
ncbi:hypothetical protein [Lichenicola sp.]|uniref:hypothetical protein n=1 Tax=Lichenicola sp. TaxID=2804529 RepID=UPI003B0053A8